MEKFSLFLEQCFLLSHKWWGLPWIELAGPIIMWEEEAVFLEYWIITTKSSYMRTYCEACSLIISGISDCEACICMQVVYGFIKIIGHLLIDFDGSFAC